MSSPPLYAEPVSSGDDDSTVWRKFCRARQQGGGVAPVNLTAPQLSDATPDEGTSVSVSNGTWSGSPTSFTYQWYLAGVLQAETSNTFTIPSDAGGDEVYAIVTAFNAAGSTPQQSDIGTVQDVDPLAGIPYRLRFETTWDKVTLRPMWQDVARTVLVTSEGETVATMGPDDAELIPEQGVVGEQGMLLLEGDGTPYINFDGADDNYPVGAASGQVVYTVLLRSSVAAWNSYWSALDQVAGTPAERWGLFQGGQTNFHNDPPPAQVRLNGVTLASVSDSLAPITDWMVLTVTTNTSGAANARAIFQLEDFQFGHGDLIAFFVYDGTPSNADRDTVEAFYETLKPA